MPSGGKNSNIIAVGGGGGGTTPEDAMPDKGTFGIGDGLVLDLDHGKYFVTGFDNTQEMPFGLASTEGLLTVRRFFNGTGVDSGVRIMFTPQLGNELYIRDSFSGSWEEWESFGDGISDKGAFDTGSGSVLNLVQGKYYVVDWFGQDMPAGVTPQVGVMTVRDKIDFDNGRKVELDLANGQSFTRIKVAGGWEDWLQLSTTPVGALADDEMVKYDATAGKLLGTGDINTETEVDFGSKDIKCKTVITESSSVEVGPGVTLSDRGGFLQNRSSVTGRDFLPVDFQVDDTGTQPPVYAKRNSKVIRSITQPDDSQTMIGVTSYNVVPTTDEDISKVYIKLVNPLTNFRAEVVSDVTGEVVKYIPSRSDFEDGTGIDYAAGEQSFDLVSPLAEIQGFPLTVNVFADQSIDVLGDGVNPWRAVDSQNITNIQVVTELDTAVESVSTSLITDVEMTESTPTTIDIPAGKGRIVSVDVPTGVPTVTEVEFPERLGVAITNIATQIATRIGIDVNGDVVQSPPELTPDAVRNYINLGIVTHASGTIGSVLNDSLKSQEVYSQLVDNFEVLGVTRKKGLAVSPNANLTFDKTAGEIQAAGAGNNLGTVGQNIVRISGETPTNFTTILGITDDVVASSQTLIDPGFYDNGTGTKVAIPAPTQQATIQYIYQSIIDPAGVIVMYGQTLYATLSEAIINAETDTVERPVTIEQETNLIGRIAVRSDATNLSDPLQAEILSGVKFGSGTDGTLSGSISGGGDVLGAASSITDELPTCADASGKVIKATSNVSAVNGVVKRISAGQALELQSGNGISKLNITPTTVDIVAKNASDSSTTTWTLLDSNGGQFGGSSLNVNSTSGSVGYKSSQAGSFKNQIYWNQVEDLTHVSHKGTNSNPNADIVMDDTAITTEFSSAKAMSINNAGRMDVNGANPEINLQSGGVSEYTWDNSSGTMRLGPTGFAAANSKLEMEFGFTTLNGGSAGYSRLRSNNTLVSADGGNDLVRIEASSVLDGKITLSTGGDSEVIDMDSSTGNVNISDGANGNANFFFGRVRLKNDSDSPNFALSTNAADTIVGGVNWETADGGFTRLYRGNGSTVYESALNLSDGYMTTLESFGAGTNEEPEGVIQSGAKVSAGTFTPDNDSPFVANTKVNNGGNTPTDSIPFITAARAGVSGQSNANGLSIDIGRYGTQDASPRTQMDFKLVDNTADNPNPPIALSLLANGVIDGGGRLGKLNLRSGIDPTISLRNEAGDTEYGGLTHDIGKFGTVLYSGDILSVDNAFTVTDTHSNTGKKLIVNSAENARAHFQVGDQFSDPGNFTDDFDSPAFINNLENNGGNTPAAGASSLILGRSGVPSEAYGNVARFDLSRWENAGTESRTQLDIRCSHRQLTTAQEGNNTPIQLSVRSDGQVSMPTTTAAFVPPRVTTAQMNAITPIGVVSNTELGLLYHGVGGAWEPLSNNVSIIGRVTIQNGIPLVGAFQPITTGNFAFYEISGQTALPDFINGIWTVPRSGTYQLNLSGWAQTTSGADAQVRVYVAVNGLDYDDPAFPGIDQVTKNGAGLAVNGICKLAAGDEVQISYTVLSGTNWILDNFRWDVSRVGS